ncbi:sigma-70 family RNA polymerase sigma factor [Macrococcus capreoli]
MMFEQLKADYDKMIYHFIHKYKLTYESDEYYQLALIKLWELDQQYDAVKTPNKSQFMYTKLNFYFIDEIRKLSKRTQRFVVTDDVLLNNDGSCNDDYDALILHELKHLLQPKEYAWLIYAIQGYKMKDIAAQLNVSVSAVKQYKVSAQQKIRQYYHVV